MGYIFSSVLEPVALIDENVCMLTEGGRTYVRIKCIEALPEKLIDLGPLVNGAETGYVEITEVQVCRFNQFSQFRILPVDNLVLQAKQPQSCQKWVTKEATFEVSKFIDEYNGCSCGCLSLTETFNHGDQSFYLKASKPDTVVDLVDNKARILVHGFVYTFETLSGMPAQYTVVPMVACGGVNCKWSCGAGPAGNGGAT